MAYAGRQRFLDLNRQRQKQEKRQKGHLRIRPRNDDYEEKGDYVFEPYHGWDKRGLDATDD